MGMLIAKQITPIAIAIISDGRVALHGDLRDIKRSYPRDRLLLRTEQPEKVKAAFGDACRDGEQGALIVQLSSAEEKSAAMEKLLGVCDVDEIKVYEPSLGDIFVEYADREGEEK